MHARAAELYAEAGELGRIKRILRERVSPSAARLDGFRGIMVMSDEDREKVLTVTLWESLEHLKASQSQEYYEESISYLIPHLKVPPEVETYEVVQLS